MPAAPVVQPATLSQHRTHHRALLQSLQRLVEMLPVEVLPLPGVQQPVVTAVLRFPIRGTLLSPIELLHLVVQEGQAVRVVQPQQLAEIKSKTKRKAKR